MLLLLADYLSRYVTVFHVFSYLTMRAILGILTALSFSFVSGPAMIRWLTMVKVGQSVRKDGPQSHLSKAGTPTMGGTLILATIMVSTLLWGDLYNRYVWILLAVTASFGAVGFADDYLKLVLKNSKGLAARYKYFWQSLFGLAAALALYLGHHESAEIDYILPFFKFVELPLGAFFVVITYFVIVGTSNAVNLTDGLDGLAIMPTVMISSALAIFAYVAGHAVFSKYLGIPHIPQAAELAVFCGALAGAGLAFLWFNAYPAEVFMGDVGALALGAALGIVTVIVRQEIVLLIMGGVFVVETLSVMLQVASFKLVGKRVFRMAPLHHHFEMMGWSETQVAQRFWLISMVSGLLGVALALI